MKLKLEITRDITSFSLHVNSKSNKSCEVEFIIALPKNLDPPFPSSPSFKKKKKKKDLQPSPASAKLLKSLYPSIKQGGGVEIMNYCVCLCFCVLVCFFLSEAIFCLVLQSV